MKDSVNTRLFSLGELMKKNYIDLLSFTENLSELIEELEEIKYDLGSLNYITDEELEDLIFIDTQLSYVQHNLNVGIDALAHYESKAFTIINESLIGLN